MLHTKYQGFRLSHFRPQVLSPLLGFAISEKNIDIGKPVVIFLNQSIIRTILVEGIPRTICTRSFLHDFRVFPCGCHGNQISL